MAIKEKHLISSLSRDDEFIDFLIRQRNLDKQRNDDEELFREIYELLENLVVDPNIDFGPSFEMLCKKKILIERKLRKKILNERKLRKRLRL